ncbi:acyl-CoA thioesterase [Flexivirga meconopsidis]|uniref:acyl-CoA thioesterase n=1 Tax=Flexivirga meconopsidis TaxID=2977121 RepID=UPI002240C6EF
MTTTPAPTDHDRSGLTLRFLAAPTDEGYAGRVSGGRVLEWIDKAAYAAAVAWSRHYCVTAYVGDVHFGTPIRVGDLVEVEARIVHTGRSSMDVRVQVRTGSPRTGELSVATECLTVFVAMQDGRSVAIPSYTPTTADQREAEADALRHKEIRAVIERELTNMPPESELHAPGRTMRFLARPTDVNWGGNVHGGNVMDWIDEAAHVLATQWTRSTCNVAVYVGGVRFLQPMHIGDLVEIQARLMRTGRTSMHMTVDVRSGDPAGDAPSLTTRCHLVFVAIGDADQPQEVPAWTPTTAGDRALERHAAALLAASGNTF